MQSLRLDVLFCDTLCAGEDKSNLKNDKKSWAIDELCFSGSQLRLSDGKVATANPTLEDAGGCFVADTGEQALSGIDNTDSGCEVPGQIEQFLPSDARIPRVAGWTHGRVRKKAAEDCAHSRTLRDL